MNTTPHRSRTQNSDWATDVSPWPEPVHAAQLLDDLAALLRRFVVLPDHADSALALWILHTYAFELRDVTAYLGIESPEKRCGKTTLLTILGELVNRPVISSNISSPAFFRVIEELRPTLLIDEADTFLQGNDELRGILNSGYTRKTAFVVRVSNQPAQPETKNARDKASPENKPPYSQDAVALSSPGTPASSTASPNQPATGPETTPSNLFDEPVSPSLAPRERAGVKGKDALAHPQGPQPSSLDIRPSTSPPPSTTRPFPPLTSIGGEGQGEEALPSPRHSQSETPRSTLAKFSSWCPKAMAAIGRLPDTLADRCIVIRMERKMSADQCERLKTLDATELKQKCTRFIADHTAALLTAVPAIPPALNDRAADIWEPLFVLADLASRDWPDRARHAALHLSGRAQATNPNSSLLIDIWISFLETHAERLFSRDIVSHLNGRGDRPWNEVNKAKPITELWLSQKLRPYQIRPRTFWIKDQCARGYVLAELFPIFRRYIPKAELESFLAENLPPRDTPTDNQQAA